MAALRDYGSKPNEEQQSVRTYSGTLIIFKFFIDMLRESLEVEAQPITLTILSSSSGFENLSEAQQKLALEYLAIELAIRDREQLVRVFCHSSPDLFISSIRAIVPAYDQIIRALHNAADLSDGVSDFEAFLNDLIKVSTIQGKAKGNHNTPSVEDYCQLLRKHQGSSHKFIHQVLKKSKDLFER